MLISQIADGLIRCRYPHLREAPSIWIEGDALKKDAVRYSRCFTLSFGEGWGEVSLTPLVMLQR